MALDLVDYEHQAREAVKAFWRNRETAKQNRITATICRRLQVSSIDKILASSSPKHLE